MLILIMIGAHRGLKAASKVMAMVNSISTKVLEGTQLAMIEFFVCDKIQVKRLILCILALQGIFTADIENKQISS